MSFRRSSDRECKTSIDLTQCLGGIPRAQIYFWSKLKFQISRRSFNLERLDKKPSSCAHQRVDLSLSLFLTVMITGVLDPTSNYKHSVIDLHNCDEFAMRLIILRRIVRATNRPRRIVRDELFGDELSAHQWGLRYHTH